MRAQARSPPKSRWLYRRFFGFAVMPIGLIIRPPCDACIPSLICGQYIFLLG